MKQAAFKLVAIVIAFQLLITAIVPLYCLRWWDERCLKFRVQEYASFVLTQAMALYAAEK